MLLRWTETLSTLSQKRCVKTLEKSHVADLGNLDNCWWCVLAS